MTDGAPALLPVLRKLDGVEGCWDNCAGGGACDGLDAATEPAEPPAPAAPAAAATTPEDLARIATEAEGIVTELRAALETESGLLKSLNEKLAALHA